MRANNRLPGIVSILGHPTPSKTIVLLLTLALSRIRFSIKITINLQILNSKRLIFCLLHLLVLEIRISLDCFSTLLEPSYATFRMDKLAHPWDYVLFYCLIKAERQEAYIDYRDHLYLVVGKALTLTASSQIDYF